MLQCIRFLWKIYFWKNTFRRNIFLKKIHFSENIFYITFHRIYFIVQCFFHPLKQTMKKCCSVYVFCGKYIFWKIHFSKNIFLKNIHFSENIFFIRFHRLVFFSFVKTKYEKMLQCIRFCGKYFLKNIHFYSNLYKNFVNYLILFLLYL